MFDAVLPKNTRSPACSAPLDTDLPTEYWAAAERGMLTPAWLQAHCIRPEQSKPELGDSPPHWYITPRWLRAASMAALAGPMNTPMSPAPPRAALAAALSLATAALASATALSAASFLGWRSARIFWAASDASWAFFCASVALTLASEACLTAPS